MPEQMRPASPAQAPDPSYNYERSHPERESPAGTLDQKKPPQHDHADEPGDAIKNDNDPQKSITSSDANLPGRQALPEQPDHSMKDEEPLGSDLSPQDIHDPERKRHPKREGKGGTRDALSKEDREKAK